MINWLLITLLTLLMISTQFAKIVADASKYSMPSAEGLQDKTSENHPSSPFEDAYEKLRTFDGISGFSNSRLYNTSIALTASFFSYNLPPRSPPGSVIDLTNQAIYGLFGLLAVALIFAVPVLLTGIKHKDTSRSNDADDDSWISSPIMKIDNVKRIFDEEFRDQIGLDSTKCLQKTICDAHRFPKNQKYGLLALPFQIFYPPAGKGSEGRATSNQIAANDGKYSKKDCAKRYKCFFDTLDLAAFLIDWYRLSNDPEYVPNDSDFE